MPHFFASDLKALAIALVLGLPLILIPGYAFGWWFRLLEFRSEQPSVRWAWALAFGLTIEPILLYIPFRLVSITGLWIVYSLLLLAGLVAIFQQDPIPHWADIPRSARTAIAIVFFLCTFLMLDLRGASGVYPPTQIIDTSFRSQVITSLATTENLPPRSMFFNPGHPTPLNYHYMFFLASGLMVRIGHGLITARMALVALSVWVALGLLVVVSIAIRLFSSFEDPARATKTAWSLLLVGGLDLLPVGSETVWRWFSGNPHPVPYADLNFWNGWGMAFGWIDTLLWAPHNLAGLLGCVVGCAILWGSRDSTGTRLYTAAFAAGLTFATAAGSAIYVTAIFAFLLFLVAIELSLNAPRRLPPILLAGATATIFAIPFLRDMHYSASRAGGSVFEFAMRPFQPVVIAFEYLHITSPLAWNLAYLLLLPLNYLFEFGAFLVAGIWWVHSARVRREKLAVREHLLIGLAALSLGLPAIIWSGTEYSNDFGYRGILPAQFVLLLWATELFYKRKKNERTTRGEQRMRQAVAAAALLGIITTVANGLLIRSAIGNFEKGTVLPGQMLRSDYSPSLLADLRNAYIWLQQNTPPDSVVQENPATWQLIVLGQYSQRPAAVYGANPSFIMNGQEKLEYTKSLLTARKLFEFGFRSTELPSPCDDLRIDFIVVQSSDSIWADRKSYVWSEAPIFSAPLVRVFPCPK